MLLITLGTSEIDVYLHDPCSTINFLLDDIFFDVTKLHFLKR